MNTHHATPLRVGIFRLITSAEQAVGSLIESGFPADRISVICPEGTQAAIPADVHRQDPAGANTSEAAIEGGAIGAVLGGLTMATGLILSGGTGLLVAGPLLGAAGAGAFAGGFVGAMATRGFEPEIADYYDQALVSGCVLVAVDTAPGDGIPSAETAESIFEAKGAEPIRLQRG